MNHEVQKVPARPDTELAPDPARQTDAMLVARVRAAGTDSVEYRYLKHVLEELAVGTLTNLEKRRQLHAAIIAKGCRLCRPVPPTYSENFRTILHLAVWSASPKFMIRQIIGGGWRATGQASVRTFFVHAAMYEFAAEYNRFWREELARSEEVMFDPEQLTTDAHFLTSRYGTDPQETAVARDIISSIADTYLRPPEADPRWRTIVVRTAQQYSQAEIADELSISAEAVSSAIRRLRRRIS